MITEIEEFTTLAGILFNVGKCASLSTTYRAGRESDPPNGVRSDWHTHTFNAVGGSLQVFGGALGPRPTVLFR